MQPLGSGAAKRELRRPSASMAMSSHERGADDVQRRGLGRDDPPAVQAAEHQRAHPVAVAGRVERGLVAEGEAEGAAQVGQQAQGRLLDAEVGRAVREQAGDDVGVGGGAVERRTSTPGVVRRLLVAAAEELGGVDEVAVVPQGEAGAGRGGAERRLGVLPGRGARRRVAGVADREVPAQRRQRLLVEDLADQPEVLEHHDLAAVADGHAGGLLAAVLQREEPEVGELRDLLAGRPDTEDAALLLGALVDVRGFGRRSVGSRCCRGPRIASGWVHRDGSLSTVMPRGVPRPDYAPTPAPGTPAHRPGRDPGLRSCAARPGAPRGGPGPRRRPPAGPARTTSPGPRRTRARAAAPPAGPSRRPRRSR
jgi:hypothetical protein